MIPNLNKHLLSQLVYHLSAAPAYNLNLAVDIQFAQSVFENIQYKYHVCKDPPELKND